MALDAKTLAEIQRKAQLGIALTNSTADKQSVYDTARANTDKEIARKAGSGQALSNTGSQYNNDMYARLIAAQKPVDTGIIATDTTPTNTSSNGYIDAWSQAQKNKQMADLDKSRKNALMNLEGEKSAIAPKYYEQRNIAAAGSQQSAKNLAEFMSQRGGVRSGANAQAEISRMGTLQNNLGSLGRQETAAFGDIARRTTGVNNAYESDLVSANAGIESSRMEALLNDMYKQREFGIQEAGLTGMYNGQQTLGGQSLGLQKQGQEWNQGFQTKQLERNNFESDRSFEMAKGQQEWEQAFQQGQFDFNKGQAAFENAFKNKSFQQSVNEAAASRGLQWASLNQRDKEFVAQEAWNKEQFNYTKEQDKIDNDLAALKVNQPEPLSDSQTKNNTFADYTSSLDTLDADELRAAFTQEKSNIIKELGPSGYNSLYSMYFDKNGNPK